MKAISPVIAVLLMIAIAVVASLVAYAWVMGYLGFQTAKTGQAVQIQSVSFKAPGDDGKRAVDIVYLQNVGDGTVKLIGGQCLYIDGLLDTGANPVKDSLPKGETTPINAASVQSFSPGDTVTIKVITQSGTYSEITKIVPEP
ncbi:MAG: type IV pilin [Candidatus Bathyarchaeota archaeon]|nr:type IV pilin [Candidatus Bathyarchaeota archaeon]